MSDTLTKDKPPERGPGWLSELLRRAAEDELPPQPVKAPKKGKPKLQNAVASYNALVAKRKKTEDANAARQKAKMTPRQALPKGVRRSLARSLGL